jgi:CRISPR/Cas system-associated exonuclease Cas4 (RecB family)
VVHKVCEDFFRWKPAPGWSYDELVENMGQIAQGILKEQWDKAKVTEKFGDDRWEETMQMIDRFIQLHRWKMDPIYNRYGDAGKAWYYTRPKFRELHVVNDELAVQGYIDAVIEVDKDEVILVDYKTSSLYRHAVSEDHQKQLYIYALLYERETGIRPKYVAVEYLLYGQVANYPVRSQFLDEVKDLIAFVHANTESKDIGDYPPNTKFKFCKWCDFRKVCQGKDPIGT